MEWRRVVASAIMVEVVGERNGGAIFGRVVRLGGGTGSGRHIASVSGFAVKTFVTRPIAPGAFYRVPTRRDEMV